MSLELFHTLNLKEYLPERFVLLVHADVACFRWHEHSLVRPFQD